MLRQNADFGHSNVISVVASAISKQFVSLQSQGEKASSQNRSRRDLKKLEEAAEENEYMQKLEEASEENEYTLFNLYAHIDSQRSLYVVTHVDGVPPQMETDTG